jgi:hypothetical protein
MAIAENVPAQAPTPAAPPQGQRTWQDVAVGAVFSVEDAASAVLAGARRAAVDSRARSTRSVSVVVELVRQRLAELAERGAAERGRLRQVPLSDRVDTLVRALATTPVVNSAVDAQLDRVLRPLVVVILDDVLARLEAEPERIQSLIKGQRAGLVDELVDKLRAGAAVGDAAVDRVLRRPAVPANGP